MEIPSKLFFPSSKHCSFPSRGMCLFPSSIQWHRWREKSGAEQGCSPVGATDLGGRNNTEMPVSDLGPWPAVA